MAKKKKPKKSRKDNRLNKAQQKFVNDRGRNKSGEKAAKLGGLPSRGETANGSGVVAMDQIDGNYAASDRRKGGKTYGWVEDHPTNPDQVVVKQRFLSDNPEGRDERDYCAASLEEGRPDAGSRIGNKPKYDKNYEEVFGSRKRGVAAGHKVFKKKYK
tara:strand:+ start:57179 stop:57652 length:474 start_codon:yes stop_codon:yes gene_type:complete